MKTPLQIGKDYIPIDDKYRKRSTKVTVQRESRDMRLDTVPLERRNYFAKMKSNNRDKFEEISTLGDGDLSDGMTMYDDLLHKTWVEVMDILIRADTDLLRLLEEKSSVSKYYLTTLRKKWGEDKTINHAGLVTARRIIKEYEEICND